MFRLVGSTAKRTSGAVNSVVSTPAGLLVSRIVASAAAIVTSPMIARSTGADGRGLIAAAMTVLMIVPIALALGLPWAVRRRCALSLDGRDLVVRSAQVLSLAMLVPAVVIGLVLNATLLSALPNAAKVWLLVGLALTPLIISRNCLYSLLVVQNRFRALFLATVSQPLTNVILILILFVSGSLNIASAIATTTTSILVSYILTSSIDDSKKFGKLVSLRSLLRESLASAGAQISEIASYRLNQLVLLPFIGSAALGNYAVAVNIALAPAPVGQAIGTATFRESANLDTIGKKEIAARTLNASVSIGFCAMLGILAVTPWAVPFFFGSEFRAAVMAAQILGIGLIFVVANYTLTSNMIAQGLNLRASFAQYIGFVVGLLAVIGFGVAFGLTGAAVGSVVGFATTSLASSVLLKVNISAWMPRWSGLVNSIRILRGKA
ncbi:oligosaccharide flippase family protein [Rhodococcus sp. BP22]|uniref:oligosaccharide flippase family protein n=1 Tax=Rhodococcus sp. BP22 TaxID=2758566 RepID=UPI0021BD7A50|nr:oligosaccharide flippase family protein [Rhodococcus sp. BP22]